MPSHIGALIFSALDDPKEVITVDFHVGERPPPMLAGRGWPTWFTMCCCLMWHLRARMVVWNLIEILVGELVGGGGGGHGVGC